MNLILADDHVELDQLLDDALESADVTQSLARLDRFWARPVMRHSPNICTCFGSLMAGDQEREAPSLAQAEHAISTLRRITTSSCTSWRA
jgi:hypothetical protein